LNLIGHLTFSLTANWVSLKPQSRLTRIQHMAIKYYAHPGSPQKCSRLSVQDPGNFNWVVRPTCECPTTTHPISNPTQTQPRMRIQGSAQEFVRFYCRINKLPWQWIGPSHCAWVAACPLSFVSFEVRTPPRLSSSFLPFFRGRRCTFLALPWG